MNRSVLATILGAIFAIMFFVLVMPQYDAIKLYRAALADREFVLAERTELINRIQELSRQLRERQSDIDRLAILVPESKQIDEVVSSIENITTNSGLQLRTMTTSQVGSKPDEKYAQINIGIDVIGVYPNFLNFLKFVEQSLRLYDVYDITISPSTETVGNNLNFSIKVNAYYVK